MSDICKSKNPLQRDGTSQEQRVLKTLLPGYVSVDERSMDDLKNFVVQYASEIVYYDEKNDVSGDWKSFFDKTVNYKSQYNTPHFALFLTFLKLFKNAQDDINQITKRHLDFYYRDVLHLSENPAVPAQVYLIFELAKHVTSHILEKDTKFKAGKDGLGNNVIFKTTAETSLNIAKVSEIKALFTNKHNIFSTFSPDPENDYRLYKSPVANSEDGNGAELENEDKSWRTFGGVQFPADDFVIDSITGADRELAETGFAFATPNLFLAEGERIVTVYLNLSSPKSLLDQFNVSQLNKAFRFKFSGEEKWIEPVWEKTYSQVLGEVDSVVEKRILDFINSAKTAADIAGIEPTEGPVFDDPASGYGDQIHDYDIGLTVAARIITARNILGATGFTSLDQLYKIKYVGIDKINDLVYSFGDPMHTVKIDKTNNRIIIKRTITRDQEAIVAYNEEKLLDPFKTNWPVLKILLNNKNEENPFIYKYLKELKLKSADIEVNVREMKNLVLQNDQSVLDPGKPFQPFGNRPIVGSNFYVGSWEAFQKSVNSLSINIKWFDLPDDTYGFRDHYKAYIPDVNKRLNNSFLVDISILNKKKWIKLTSAKDQLFDNNDYETLNAENTILIPNSSPGDEPLEKTIGNVQKDEQLETFNIFDQKSQRGFIRLSLKGIDFGHKDYQLSYTKAVLDSINIDVSPPVGDYSDGLPKEPYTPTIEELSVDYVATDRIIAAGLTSEELKEVTTSAFNLGAFGVAELDASEKENYLFAQYDNEGELYIGIKDINPPQNLSILFQFSEGTSNPDIMPPDIVWEYLANDEWKKFTDQQILSDSTKGMITTGIILFDIPKTISKNNTILTNGLYWLKASAEKNSGGIPRLVDIKYQAAVMEFEDNDNDPYYLGTPLPEKTVSKLVEADSSIKKTEQPFVSFGGKIMEQSDEFYTRVSERLRHKNRAITIWDFERIVLQNFSSVYKVKCLNHTRYEGTFSSINEASPGHVSLIIISNIRNSNVGDPLKPRTSLVVLSDIKTFIQKIQSPFIKLYVNNPVYEEVQVDFNVKFLQGYDKGIYQLKLEEALIQYLSPWAYEAGSDIIFGGKIHKSVILNFVEELEYVDYITCFKMYHIVPDDPKNDPNLDVDEAVASTSASVLGSSGSHKIKVLESEGECACPDNKIITVEIASSDECPCD